MKNVPAAFLSYSRFDDEHEKGRISTIRERLSGEVQVQTGEQFQIFQDRQDIAWGQQWKRRIAESLDAVTFLIPILTPSFFKSEACRGELERFLDRETKLARNDLILPVLYIDCPVLKDTSMQVNDPLAKVLATRQHLDWRELRFEDIDSPPVKKMFAHMATQIREAIDRTNSKKVADTSSVSNEMSVTEASETTTVKKHADDRLNTEIDFGSSLAEIAGEFKARMDEFNSIDGGGPDKFRDLAAHVYSCVAASLDRYLTRARTTAENRAYVDRVSQRLKQLADYGSFYRKDSPFSKYWDDGTQVADELLAHVRHLERLAT